MKRLGLALLAIVGAAAIGASWLSPNPPDRRFPNLLYAPPTSIHIVDDGVRAPFVHPLRLVSRLERRFAEDTERRVALRWLSRDGLVAADPDEGAPLLLLGADGFGRDLFSRLLHASRVTLALAVIATLGATALGALLGAVAGYAGGWLDGALMRVSEGLLVLPAVYVVLALRAALPLVVEPATTFVALAGIFTVFGWPIVAKGVRAIVASEREREYVHAARALGAGPARILVTHILPSVTGHLATQATLLLPAFILAEATMSFVGLGFPDRTPTWGTLLQEAANVSMLSQAPWTLAPAAAIFVVVLGVNLVLQRSGRVPCTIGRMYRFDGVFTPITTPFRASDGAFDDAAMRANVARWMATPLTGVVVLGSNGEAPQLDDDEADRVVSTVREGVPEGRPLLVGTGRESTRATIAATRRAAAAGADAVLVRTPSFFKAQMTGEALERHYREVADAASVPVLLYNVTMFTGVTLPPDSVARLAEHPNIVGMKESGSDIAYIADCITRTPEDFTVLAGSATTFFHALCAGCDGGVLALASLFPEQCVLLRTLVKGGSIDDAREQQRRLTPIARSIGGTYGVAGLKAALDLIGFAGGPPRPPLRPAPSNVVDIIRRQLHDLGAVPSTP